MMQIIYEGSAAAQSEISMNHSYSAAKGVHGPIANVSSSRLFLSV